MTTRRALLAGGLGAWALVMSSGCGPLTDTGAGGCPSDPSASGGVDWQPDIGRPVFWGVQDLTASSTADSPPLDTLVYYPTYEGTPLNAAMLEKCLTRWPVVLFLHGQPPNGLPLDTWYRKWTLLPAQLARCGYVVVVPSHGAALPQDLHPEQADVVLAVTDWVRNQWVHAQWVDPRMDYTAVAGHSYGALLAARIAKLHPEFAAFASLSGGYFDLNDGSTATNVYPPSFFMWARGETSSLDYENLDLNDGQWDRIPQWKYRAIFNGYHFDYLPAEDTGDAFRGACPQVGALTAALVSLFIAENLPAPLGTTHVGVDLQAPHVQLTQQQQFFAGGHLTGLDAFAGDRSCHLELSWDYDTQTGSRTIGGQ